MEKHFLKNPVTKKNKPFTRKIEKMSRFFTFIAIFVVIIAIVSSLALAADTVPQLHNAKRGLRLQDAPCPKQDEHKLKCALAITECVAECIADDWTGCVQCILEKVGKGELKECCQTISHYAHFGCSKCNDLDVKALNATKKH